MSAPFQLIDFNSIVRQNLGSPPSDDPAARRVIYDETWRTLNGQFAGQLQSEAHWALSNALRRAIDDIEASFQSLVPENRTIGPASHGESQVGPGRPNEPQTSQAQTSDHRSRFVRSLDGLNRTWSFGERVVKAGFVLVCVGLFAWLPYWYLFSAEDKIPSIQRGAIEQTACKLLAKEQCDALILAVERTKNRGAITAANAGDLGPAKNIAQENARLVEADPNASAQLKQQAAADVATLGFAIARIERNTERAADSAERIETVALGGLQGAFETRNFRNASRLIKEGAQVSTFEFVRFVERGFDPQVAALLVKHKSQIDSRLCTEEFFPISPVHDPSGFMAQTDFMQKNLDTDAKKDFFFSICDKSAIMKIYRDKLTALKQLDDQRPLRNAELEQKRRACIDDFRAKYMARAQSANPREGSSIAQDVYSELWKMEDEAMAGKSNSLQSEFLSRSRAESRSSVSAGYIRGENAITIVGSAIQTGCLQVHPDLPKNQDDIARLQKKINIIAQQTGLQPIVFSQPVTSEMPNSSPGLTTQRASSSTIPSMQAAPPALPPPPVALIAPPLSNPQTLGSPTLEPPLAPAVIRAEMMSRIVLHGNTVYVYFANGDMEISVSRDKVIKGTYRIEPSGRVCWNASQAKSCFEYYRRSGSLRVRGADANNRSDIGPVKLEGRITPPARP